MNYLVSVLFLVTVAVAQDSGADTRGVVKMEFVFEQAPFAQCHASTIALCEKGPVAAWFGGKREGHPGVGIWLSRRQDKGWTDPVEVADGVQYREGDKTHSYACWNPVLFKPEAGDLQLFYKCGRSPSEWWGMQMASADAGETWSAPVRLPERILGPVKNKPVELKDGSWLCGSSTEGSRTGWVVHFERTADRGRTWERVGPLKGEQRMQCIQPTLLRHKDALQMLCRTKHDVIGESWSRDDGKTWSPISEALLPNPNSGIDAVTLHDGRHLLVYNHGHRTRYGRGANGRDSLHVAISRDGKDWLAAVELENEPGMEFSYPSVVQGTDGQVHITYTHKRTRIRHVVLDPAKLQLRAMVDGAWPRAR